MSEQPKYLNFLLCIDRNFILGAGTLIASILDNHPDQAVRFFIFTASAFKDQAKEMLLSRLTKRFDCTDKFIFNSYDEISLFEKMSGKVNQRILVQCMRIIAVKACGIKNSNTLIYLDADIVCCRPLTELADINFEGNPLAIAGDEGEKIVETGTNDQFHIKNYFCSGF